MAAHPDLSDRLIAFSARIIRLLDHLPSTKAGREIEGQLIRSGMGVGSNYNEARGADSRADFCHKLQIALKEMRETHYWLCVIDKAELVADASLLRPLLDESTQLRAILGKSVATARGKARSSAEPPDLLPAG
jgi:four helix bundle protein